MVEVEDVEVEDVEVEDVEEAEPVGEIKENAEECSGHLAGSFSQG